MKVTTSIRLKQIMEREGLKQVDILNKCQPYCEKYGVKLSKNYLSQYVSGKVEPGQRILSILSKALGVSEVWLMGYDVEDGNNNKLVEMTSEQIRLFTYFSKLNDTGKKKALERVEELTYVPMYDQEIKKESEKEVLEAAHERTDIEVTDEMRKYDDELMRDDDIWDK